MAGFTEMITFQVKPDKLDVFERLIADIKELQAVQPGCTGIRYFKRFYTFDGVEWGEAPREISRIVKCVKYYGWWEFESREACGKAMGWFFSNYNKEISRLLIMPFEINSGYNI